MAINFQYNKVLAHFHSNIEQSRILLYNTYTVYICTYFQFIVKLYFELFIEYCSKKSGTCSILARTCPYPVPKYIKKVLLLVGAHHKVAYPPPSPVGKNCS